MNTIHILALFLVYFMYQYNSKTDMVADKIPNLNIAKNAFYFNIAPILYVLYSQLGTDAWEHIYIIIIYTMLYNIILKALTPESKKETFLVVAIACYLSLMYNEKISVQLGYILIGVTSFFNVSNRNLTTYALVNELLLVHFLFYVSKK